MYDDTDVTPYDDEEPRGSGRGAFADAASAATFDSLSWFTFAAMLIGAGVLFFIAQASSGQEDAFISYANLHWWLVIGAGLILLGEVLARVLIPRFRTRLGGRLLLIVVLVAVGVGGKVNVAYVPPILLVGLGVVILVSRLGRATPGQNRSS